MTAFESVPPPVPRGALVPVVLSLILGHNPGSSGNILHTKGIELCFTNTISYAF